MSLCFNISDATGPTTLDSASTALRMMSDLAVFGITVIQAVRYGDNIWWLDIAADEDEVFNIDFIHEVAMENISEPPMISFVRVTS